MNVIAEELARYIFNRSQFSPVNQRVKYSAFLPPANRRLSVFRVSNLGENEIWGIGNSIETEREIPLLARADIKADYVMEAGLKIESDENPPLHANIIGWPDAVSEMKLKAIELAEKARLYIKA